MENNSKPTLIQIMITLRVTKSSSKTHA